MAHTVLIGRLPHGLRDPNVLNDISKFFTSGVYTLCAIGYASTFELRHVNVFWLVLWFVWIWCFICLRYSNLIENIGNRTHSIHSARTIVRFVLHLCWMKGNGKAIKPLSKSVGKKPKREAKQVLLRITQVFVLFLLNVLLGWYRSEAKSQNQWHWLFPSSPTVNQSPLRCACARVFCLWFRVLWLIVNVCTYCCCGDDVDAIDYYTKQFESLTAQV